MPPTLRALIAFAITACAGTPGLRPSSGGEVARIEASDAAGIVLPRASGEVTAYRHEVHLGGVEHGQSWSEERRGVLYLEPDHDGVMHVSYEDDGEVLQPLPIDDRSAVDMYFPSSDREVPRTGAERAWDVTTMAPFPASPLILIERLATSVDPDGRRVVTFERAGTLADGTPLAMRIEQDGQAQLDAGGERYETVVMETTLSLLDDSAEVLRARAELTYDPAATLARIETREALAQAELEGAGEQEGHTIEQLAEVELGEIRSRLLDSVDDRGDPTVLEIFHARANPRSMWQTLLDLPSGAGRDHLIQLLAIEPALRGQRLPDEIVPMVRERLVVDEELAELVMILGDDRFRREIEGLARRGDPTRRARARAALAQMEERVRPSLLEVSNADEPELMLMLAGGYIEGAADPRDVVPLLLEVLAGSDEDPWVATAAIVLLERITCRAIGDDPAAWRAFYDAYRERPYVDWLYDASHERDRIARLAAAMVLDERGDPRGRERLRELARDRDRVTRFVAAEALANVGDAFGLPQIIVMMRDPSRPIRGNAFLALAHLAPQTFGYDPAAPALERARAMGRIERWAATR